MEDLERDDDLEEFDIEFTKRLYKEWEDCLEALFFNPDDMLLSFHLDRSLMLTSDIKHLINEYTLLTEERKHFYDEWQRAEAKLEQIRKLSEPDEMTE